METKNGADKNDEVTKTGFLGTLWEESWTYIKTVVDIVRDPILILDKNLRVMAANESFYTTFQVEQKNTEGEIVYELGNGQWDIPDLRKLLEDILPKNTFFKGFEVTHEFPTIGRKIMILNARQIHPKENASEVFPPIILLSIEDVTDMMAVAETLASHANSLEAKLAEQTGKLTADIEKLEKEVDELKEKLHNPSG
ncbi:MAG: PAS domain-containing protein [Candidatus Colwellbacteria bacterium]|nr:PAS domain-containing protein [Candidatus Colwellbacteria bacterium]